MTTLRFGALLDELGSLHKTAMLRRGRRVQRSEAKIKISGVRRGDECKAGNGGTDQVLRKSSTSLSQLVRLRK